MWRQPFSFAFLCGLAINVGTGAEPMMKRSKPKLAGPLIRTEDVELFYRIYDAAGGHPTAAQLQHDYLDAGSDGLHRFASIREISGERIAAELAKNPKIYAEARKCAAVLPQVHRRLSDAMRKLAALYPEATFPPITVAISRGKPVAAGSPRDGVMIGLEALCGVKYFDADVEDRAVHVIAHEYVHVQQSRAIMDKDHPTLLEASLVEGAAEFVGELISGGRANPGVVGEARGHEAAIENRFSRELDSTDVSAWLYNGTLENAGDLGYWVGYRIVSSYYRRARNKRQAVKDILRMADAKDFLRQSRWHPSAAR